jgi:hypothetical protein
MSTGNIPEGWESERGLAGRWDVDVKGLAHYRQGNLREGIHYGRPNGLQIYYTVEGIRALREHFQPRGLEEIEVERLAEKQKEQSGYALPPVPGTALSEKICRVTRLCGNPRMVTLENGEGKGFYLYVRNNSKFRKGMLVDLRSCERRWDGGPLPSYELRIPLPRYAGRWGYSALTNAWLGRSGEYIRRSLHKDAVGR